MSLTLIKDANIVRWVIGMVALGWDSLPAYRRNIYTQALLRVNNRLSASEALAYADSVNGIMALMGYSKVAQWLFMSEHRLYQANESGWTRFEKEFNGSKLSGPSLWNIYRTEPKTFGHFLATYKYTQPIDIVPVNLYAGEVTNTATAMIVALHIMGKLPRYISKWVHTLTRKNIEKEPSRTTYVLDVMSRANQADKLDFMCGTVTSYASKEHIECFFNKWLYPRTPEGLTRLMDDLKNAVWSVRRAVLANYAKYPQYVTWDTTSDTDVLIELSASGLRPTSMLQDCYYFLARDYEAWKRKKGEWPEDEDELKNVTFDDIFKEH